MMVRAILALPLFLILLLAGCYSYAAIEPGAIESGMGVRARVSAPAGERIAPLLGTSEARLLSGTLISSGRDTLIVEVPTVARMDGTGFAQTLHQRVSIARAELLELEARKLDRLRTGALVGSAVAIVSVILIRAFRGEPGKERLPPDGTNDALIPLFRVIR